MNIKAPFQVSEIVTPDFSTLPYWWQAAPPDVIDATEGRDSYDVIIIGSGITGLRAALELSRGGATVLVAERDGIGSGASRRNAGFLGRVLKKSFVQLAAKHGEQYAKDVYSELDCAYRGTMAFIAAESIACYATECGRFIAATSPAHLAGVAKEMEKLSEVFGYRFTKVDADAARTEMGSDIYHGGIVVPDLGSLHPGLYHQGLLRLALSSGATVWSHTPVSAMERRRSGHRFRVKVADRDISADHVIVATNGYTPKTLGWHARRVIPFTGYMAATEELPDALLDELMPRNRTIIDSNTNIDFFRRAPDSPRLLFGGDTGCGASEPEEIVSRMRKVLSRVFPQAAHVRLSRVWSGQCAGTFDLMPHIGCDDGLWYGLGYNFAGVPMGTHFGHLIARQILEPQSQPSVFMNRRFATIPFYNGNPWFVPLAMRFFDWQDRMLAWRSA